MNAEELRSVQAPLKERYRNHPIGWLFFGLLAMWSMMALRNCRGRLLTCPPAPWRLRRDI
jgi:hypothetical protein